MSGNGETAGSPNARQALLQAVDEHATEAGAPVGDIVEAALEDVDGGLGRVCSALQQLHANGEVYQPTPTSVRRVATDGGQLTRRQQRQAEKLQLQYAAEQGREQRLQTALETGQVEKQGQRVWIIPEFQPDDAESEYIKESVREALPEYDCQLAVDSTKPMTKERIHDMLLDADDEEQDVRTDGGRDGGWGATISGESRVLDQKFYSPSMLLREFDYDPNHYRLYTPESDDPIEPDTSIDLAKHNEFVAIPGTTSYGSNSTPETGSAASRLEGVRKQLRLVLDDVLDEDEDAAEYVEGALACAESAAVCLEGPEVLEDEPSITDAPVPMVTSVGPLGTTVAGPEPGAYQRWGARREEGGER